MDLFSTNIIKVLNNPKTKTHEVYLVEQKLLKTSLEFDLLSKQAGFQKECNDFDRKQNAS